MQQQIQPSWLDLVREFSFFLFLLMLMLFLGLVCSFNVEFFISPGRGLNILSSEKERKEKVIIQEVGDFGIRVLSVYVLLSSSVYIYYVRKIQYCEHILLDSLGI